MHAKAYSDPVFQAAWEEDGKPSSCLRCHTTGYSAETDTYALEGVTCEQCHGEGMEMTKTLSAELCGSCHEDMQTTFSEWNESAHAASLPDLLALDRPDITGCMPCRTTQGFLTELKGETASPDEPLDTITCAACHDPHGENEHQLRIEPAADLCGACHTGGTTLLHHPQYEYWKEGPHGLAEVGCESCHMYTKPYFSEEEPAATGHTFEIEEGRPLTCGNCHGVLEGIISNEVAVRELNEIHEWFEEEESSISTLIEDATTAIEHTNSTLHSLITEGVPEEVLFNALTTLNASTALVEEAKAAYESVEADASKGLHNPTFYTEKFVEAKLIAENAIDLAEASAKLGEAMKGVDIDEAMKEAISKLEATLKDKEGELKEAETELEISKTALNDTEKKLTDTQTKLATTESALNDTQKQLSDVTQAQTQLQSAIKELENRILEIETGANEGFGLYLGLVVGLIIGIGIAYALRRKRE